MRVYSLTQTCRFLSLVVLTGPTWLKNLYFAYTVVLRAITKAAPFWEQEQFYTGDYEDDLKVQQLVQVLLTKSKYGRAVFLFAKVYLTPSNKLRCTQGLIHDPDQS